MKILFKKQSIAGIFYFLLRKNSSIKHNAVGRYDPTNYQIWMLEINLDLDGRNKVSDSPQYKTLEIRIECTKVIQTSLATEASYN